MKRTLEIIHAEWIALNRVADALDADNPEWSATIDKMDALEIEMRAHPARTLREAAMKAEPWMLNTQRDINFTGIIEDLRTHLAPPERVAKPCPDFVYCARTGPDLDQIAAPMTSTEGATAAT